MTRRPDAEQIPNMPIFPLPIDVQNSRRLLHIYGQISRILHVCPVCDILHIYGTGWLIVSDYPDTNVKVKLDLYQGTPGTYVGFDRFGRTVDVEWIFQVSLDWVRLKYGYDAVGNRTWREDVVACTLPTPVHLDEYYSYDGLHRLVDPHLVEDR